MNDTFLETDDTPPDVELVPESDLDETGEPQAAPEIPGIDEYPWANGDPDILLRSKIFDKCADAEVWPQDQFTRMQTAFMWIKFGQEYVAPPEPAKRSKGNHLKPVET